MKSTMSIITGSEDSSEAESEQLRVLINFYKAFNYRDILLMQSVWLNNEEASMNNPVGGIMRGWDEIKSVYEKIFNGEAKVYVEFYDFTLHATEHMFFVTGREKGYFKKEAAIIELAIRTSRIFIRHNNQWKQIQHHGSIDNPGLLEKYQHAILKR